MIQLSGINIVTYSSSPIPSEHDINSNFYNPMCKIYIKAILCVLLNRGLLSPFNIKITLSR